MEEPRKMSESAAVGHGVETGEVGRIAVNCQVA